MNSPDYQIGQRRFLFSDFTYTFPYFKLTSYHEKDSGHFENLSWKDNWYIGGICDNGNMSRSEIPYRNAFPISFYRFIGTGNSKAGKKRTGRTTIKTQ